MPFLFSQPSPGEALNPQATGDSMPDIHLCLQACSDDAKPLWLCAAMWGILHALCISIPCIYIQSSGNLIVNRIKSPLLHNYRGQAKRVLKLFVSQVIRMRPKVSKLPAIKGISSLANPLQGLVCGKHRNAPLFLVLLDIITFSVI